MNQDPRIRNIKVIPPHGLEIRWKDKSSDRVDMTGVLWQHPVFAPLRDAARFARVEIINWGHGIEWPEDGLDYAAQNLQRLARLQTEMTEGDFSAWQARLKLSNQEAADVLGVTLSTIKNYRNGRSLPRPTQLGCKVIEDDRILLDAFYRPRKTGRPRASEIDLSTVKDPADAHKLGRTAKR
jgi:hypothetical protein